MAGENIHSGGVSYRIVVPIVRLRLPLALAVFGEQAEAMRCAAPISDLCGRYDDY